MRADALHIAAATLANVDVLVSWNFKHIVNLNRIQECDKVNRPLGYHPVNISTPQKLENDERERTKEV